MAAHHLGVQGQGLGCWSAKLTLLSVLEVDSMDLRGAGDEDEEDWATCGGRVGGGGGGCTRTKELAEAMRTDKRTGGGEDGGDGCASRGAAGIKGTSSEVSLLPAGGIFLRWGG